MMAFFPNLVLSGWLPTGADVALKIIQKSQSK
jgi:hypothetical protein